MMNYKGYLGTVEYDDQAKIFHGDIINTRDVITFQGTTVKEIERAFRDSIDDYLAWCKEDGVEPEKPYSGRFNLSIIKNQIRTLDNQLTAVVKYLWVVVLYVRNANKETIMINLKSSFTPINLFTLCLAALALAGCQDPMSGGSYDGREGSFSISIGAVARQVLSWDDSTEISSLVHTITLTGGPDADIKQEGVKFGQTANFTVASGRWTISVYAYHDGVLKAEGFAAVDIKPGPNGAIPIKMGTISVTGVTITPAALSLNVGGTAILTAEITPANAVNRNVTWASSDDAVATVSNGTVSAISAGTATITVTTKDGAKTANCAVTVSPLANDIPVTFISVTADGGASRTTTGLTLTFDKAITGLSAADISVSGVPGVTKGALSGSGTAYALPISGFTSGGNLSVSVTKTGYTISGSPKTVGIYYNNASGGVINISFDQITDAAPNIAGPRLSRSGTPKEATLTVTGSYDSISWEITGTGFTGTGITRTGNSFRLDATDVRYNQIGAHQLSLLVIKNGVPYNKIIIFTIVQ